MKRALPSHSGHLYLNILHCLVFCPLSDPGLVLRGTQQSAVVLWIVAIVWPIYVLNNNRTRHQAELPPSSGSYEGLMDLRELKVPRTG